APYSNSMSRNDCWVSGTESKKNAFSPMKLIAQLLREPTLVSKKRRVGIEVERIGIWGSGQPFLYRSYSKDSRSFPGAEDLLTELVNKFHWEAGRNSAGQPLGLQTPYGKVSLEPGSQLEISPDPFDDLKSLAANISEFEKKVDSVSAPWGLVWL